MSDPYAVEQLTDAVAESKNWTDLMRRLGFTPNGGRRRILQERVAHLGLDTGHFAKRSPYRKYPDEVIAAAAASSTTLRELVVKLGVPPATGTLSHIRRRIEAAGIDTSHFPGLNRTETELPFTREELASAAAASQSIRGVARNLGVADDSRSRAALGHMLRKHHIDTAHFRNARLVIPEEPLRTAVAGASSFADVMRALGLPVGDVNHRRIRRRVDALGLDTSHFERRSWREAKAVTPAPIAARVLVELAPTSGRANRTRLHAALQEIGVRCACASCGNTGEWLGQPITLQIDHINGDWRDNRAENLRYLCPNCHALTPTWCRNRKRSVAS